MADPQAAHRAPPESATHAKPVTQLPPPPPKPPRVPGQQISPSWPHDTQVLGAPAAQYAPLPQLLPAQHGSPGLPQAAHRPVALLLAPWQIRPDAQLLVPPQQMSPAAWPQLTHMVVLLTPPVVVQRAPDWHWLFAQHIEFGAPQIAQTFALSQTVPLLQLPPAQHG